MTIPTLDELLTEAHVVALQMRVPFRGVRVREALVFRGPQGWGEFSPFVEYPDAEAALWLAAGLEAGWARSSWPDPVRERVPVNATMPAVAAEDVPEVLARFDGCTTVKVKVAERGQSLADDVARVRAVRRELGPTGRLRIDANGAWSVDEALVALEVLAKCDLEYVEQPCAGVAELAELRSRLAVAGIRVPIAADESIRKAEDPLRVARAGAADLVVLKVAPLGGVVPAFTLAERLRSEFGLGAVVSSALDTSIGIAAGVALAAALPELEHACGLGTVSLFALDLARPPLRAVGGFLGLHAPQVDPEALSRLAVAPDRRQWWLDRLQRCHGLLAKAS